MFIYDYRTWVTGWFLMLTGLSFWFLVFIVSWSFGWFVRFIQRIIR